MKTHLSDLLASARSMHIEWSEDDCNKAWIVCPMLPAEALVHIQHVFFVMYLFYPDQHAVKVENDGRGNAALEFYGPSGWVADRELTKLQEFFQ